jgi:UDP-N-acetylglucosamine transferase subunit ALG13
MLFLTIGTLFGFDRLVKAVDDAIADGRIPDEVFAQIGPGEYKPRHMRHVEVLSKDEFERTVAAADGLISHAGIGSITAALRTGRPTVVLPRLKRYGEHVNDHQLHTALKFEELGCVLVAHDTADLPACCARLKTFRPATRSANVKGLAGRLRQYLTEVESLRTESGASVRARTPA